MPCRAMPNAWPPPLQAAPASAHATGIVIPNRTVPAATPRSIFIPLFIRTSLVNESPCRSNSSVLRLHSFIHQVALTRKKVTRTGQVEQRSNPGTTDQRANVSLHRIAIIDTGCPPLQVNAQTSDYSWGRDRPRRVLCSSCARHEHSPPFH